MKNAVIKHIALVAGISFCWHMPTSPYSSKLPIIVFDDSVVFTISKKDYLAIIWEHLGASVRGIGSLGKVRELKKRDATVEEWQEALQNNPEFAECIIELARSKKPEPTVIEILRELKKNGYKIHLLWGTGRENYEFYKKIYPDVFELFTEVFVMDQEDEAIITKKPSTQYYNAYKKRFPSKAKRILVDPKRSHFYISGMDEIIAAGSSKKIRQELESREILPLNSCTC